MNRFSDNSNGLKKSTKVTMLSCGSFVVLTLLILGFFILFPITPSEKIISNIGRGENISQDNNNQPIQSGVPAGETTSAGQATTAANTSQTTTAKKKVSTGTKTSVNIVITQGSGFNNNGRIPTGGMPGSFEYTTTAADYQPPYVPATTGTGTGYTDPDNPYTEPTGSGGDFDPNYDPNGQGTTNANPNNGNGNGNGTGNEQGGNTVTPEPVVPDTPEPVVPDDPTPVVPDSGTGGGGSGSSAE